MTRSAGRKAADTAFTLIEAVVAVMVVSVIVAVAVPAFQGFHRSAQDRGAQEEIGRVLLAEQALWQREGRYTDAPEELSVLAPQAVVHAGDPAAGVTVTVNLAAGVVCVERTSASGATFGVWESAARGSFYGEGGVLTAACPDAPPGGYGASGW